MYSDAAWNAAILQSQITLTQEGIYMIVHTLKNNKLKLEFHMISLWLVDFTTAV